MSRVEWTRRTADEVEEVLGILLCSRYGLAATRVRPSRGDKGIDVFVLTPDGWIVFQIKSFTSSLTSSHKSQITKSWETFKGYAEEEELGVKEWYVLRPLNPTLEDRKWLETLTDGAPFPCGWLGLDYCEALVAEHPAVVDYYLFDGKDRLDSTIAQYLAIVGFQRPADDGAKHALGPADGKDALVSIHEALNRFDPFYRYDFSVADASGGLPEINLDAPHPPGIVASVTSAEGGRALTFHIFERFRDAILERPIPVDFVPEIEPDSAEAKAWADFVKFGVPIKGLPLRSVTMDLPGGLGVSEAADATAWIGPARRRGEAGPDLTLKVLSAEGAVLVEVLVHTEPASVGLDGKGVAIDASESAGVFNVAFRGEVDGSEYTFSMSNISGAAPGAVLDGLRFLELFRPPNQFGVSIAHGPAVAPPHEITSGFGDLDELHAFVHICEALAQIQEHTHLFIKVPELVSAEEADDWLFAAALLSGQTVEGTWTEMPMKLHPVAALDHSHADQFMVMVRLPLTVTVSGVEVSLGRRQLVCKSARIDPESMDAEVVRLIPGDDNSMTTEWVPDEDP